jgi:multidrug efflux pump subunit AcrA (membrane-fusion protein)
MIASRKRITLQLTPLLDLLLIVVFAQFMLVKQSSTRVEAKLSEEKSSLDSKSQELSRLELLLAELQAALKDAKTQANQSELDKSSAENRVGQLQSQQQLIAGYLRSLFQDTANKLNAPDAAENIRFVDDITAKIAKDQTQQLAQASPGKIIRHVLTYEEVIKRTDLWDMHVTSQNLIVLKTPSRTVEFRASTPQEFTTQVFSLYKSISQPKGLVIILYSYGDARADVRQAVEQGIPMVTERMRADAGTLTRFEYANLGFQEQSTLP